LGLVLANVGTQPSSGPGKLGTQSSVSASTLVLSARSHRASSSAGLGIDPALEKRIQAHLRGGKGIRKVARECGVGTGTVQRVQQEMKGPFVAA
jgi:hypothetical protein